MAEDKKPDDTKKSKGSVLYDQPKGQPKRGSREARSAGADKPKGEAKKDEPSGAPKAEDKKEGAEAAKGDGKKDAAKPEAKPKDDRGEMHRRHEAERRDFHNQQRDAHRAMTSRHEKEIRSLNEKAADVAQPAETVPGNEPAAPQAQVPAAAAAAA